MKTILQRMMCMAVTVMACMSVNAQNNCGTDDHEADVTWELNGSQLIFSGAGEIKTYSNENPSAYPWYNHASNIQTVIIGEGITNIPAWAFAMYENLRSIHLPSTLKTIGWSCLEETNLWNVSLPEGLETIEGYAFMMTPFSTVSIPSTVKEIGERAFGYCENLVSIGCYADKPPTLGSNAFGDSPIETVYVKSAKISTYKDTAGWENFGDKIQSPAGYCGPNGSDDDGDDDITKATWSFDMATRTLTIEGTKMGQYNRPWESAGMGGSGGGFNPDNNVGYPQGICHIVIGEGITVIPAYAFYMEVGVTDVVLPSTLESIGMQTFGENFNLTTVTINATTPPTFGENMFSDCPKLAEIIVPSSAVDNYKAADGWSDYAALIVAGGAPVATTTTFTYTASEKLTVFDNTTYFTGATAVKSHEFAAGTGTVVYDGTVTAIADYTFYYNNDAKAKMTGITIPASVETIGIWAFAQSEVLASVTFAGTSSLASIGDNAFLDCTKLTTITLPESLTTLGSIQDLGGGNVYYNGSVFAGAGLTSIEIPKNFTTLYGGGHFADCPLTSLTVNAANTKFDSRDGCNAVVETATNKIVMGCVATTVPSGIEAIGYEAFFGESQTFSLVLPASVTTIEDRAFHWADGLKTITIPMGVTAITEETFLSAEGVTDVYCYASPTITWEGLNQAFKYGTKSVNIHVSASDLSTWEANFPDANAFFVGDLGTVAGNDVEGVYWATYYNSAANMKADANTTVYKAAVNGSSITLTEIADNVITAGQAVILKSTGANVSMTTQAAASADDYSGNALEGVDVATAPAGGYKYYVLSNEGSTLGFYHYTGATLGANKAFIKVADAGGAPVFYAFDFSGETTGINTLNVKRGTWNGEVYNLAGQRVAQPTKGLYIVNGKKVVIK